MKKNSILIKNIYYMLSYAFTNLKSEEYKSVQLEEFENVHNLFAAILSKGIGKQLKQGLYREYIGKTENLNVIRGKVVIPEAIKNKANHRNTVTCDYDELSVNNAYNQIIKTTVLLLLRHAKVEENYKNDLRKEMLFFEEVDAVDPKTIHWSNIRFYRNNITYQMLINICQMIIEGMLLSTDNGDYNLASFIDEQRMSKLYERFILEYYTAHHPDLSPSAPLIPWAEKEEHGSKLPIMKSDIVLEKDNRILIIDAKYYTKNMQEHFDTYSIVSGNLYQIFTYVKNMSALHPEKKVSGLLLYAKTDYDIQPDGDYELSGNKIMAKTLNLYQDFSNIASSLDEIASTL